MCVSGGVHSGHRVHRYHRTAGRGDLVDDADEALTHRLLLSRWGTPSAPETSTWRCFGGPARSTSSRWWATDASRSSCPTRRTKVCLRCSGLSQRTRCHGVVSSGPMYVLLGEATYAAPADSAVTIAAEGGDIPRR